MFTQRAICRSFLLAGILVIVILSSAIASVPKATIFGPEICIRDTAQPITEEIAFQSLQAGTATLEVRNGAKDDAYTGERVSSSRISLNNTQLLTPNSFNQNTDLLEVPVVLLEGQNILTVELRSKPGSALSIRLTANADKIEITPFDKPIEIGGNPLICQLRVTGLGMSVLNASVKFEISGFEGIEPIISKTDFKGEASAIFNGFKIPGTGEVHATVLETEPVLTDIEQFEVVRRLKLPKGKPVGGAVEILRGSSLPSSQLTVVTFLDKQPLNEQYQFSLQAVDENTDQLIFLLDNQGNAVLPAYIFKENISTGISNITAVEVALAFIMSNPFLIVIPDYMKEEAARLAQLHPSFYDLCQIIEEAIAFEPRQLVEYSVNPQLYKLAASIGVDVLKGPMQTQLQALAMTIGPIQDPHIEDVTGPNVTLVNPRLCFYGCDISYYAGGTPIEDILMKGRDSLLTAQWGWPPIIPTPPDKKEYNLGDGQFKVGCYKGFNFDESNWLDPRKAPGQATWGNFLNTVNIFLKWLAWSPIDKGDIKAIIDIIDDPNLEGFLELGEAINNDWVEVLKRTIRVMAIEKNWDRIAYWIWQEVPGIKTTDMLRSAEKIISGVSTAVLVLKVVDAANKDIPFLWDLVTGPSKVIYEVEQTNGILSKIALNVPPIAILNVDPAWPTVGEVVLFDAGMSEDDEDDLASLQIRWDFDGDGNWDTGWSNSVIASHTFTNSGLYVVRVQVKDTDGAVGSSLRYLYVESKQAGGSATHVKVFRDNLPWDSLALESVMAQLGITPGAGDWQYEILDSNQMGINILNPEKDLVLIVNDQSQTYYNRLAASYGRFDRFIRNGGTVFWGACDLGWHLGSMAAAGLGLPGGVNYRYSYDQWNYVVDNSGPAITFGLPEALYGTYASHEGFYNLPAIATFYVIDQSGFPTLVEYGLDDGWVIMTGQPLEYHVRFGESPAPLFSRIIRYVLGLPPIQQGLTKELYLNPMDLGNQQDYPAPSHIAD